MFFGVRFGEGEGGGPSISVSGVIMQKFHTGTLHEEEGREAGGRGSLNQIKACVLLKSGKQQHPGEDVVGMKLYDPAPLPPGCTDRIFHVLLFIKRHLLKKNVP